MKEKKLKPKILTPTESLTIHYPQAHTFQDLQQKAFWTVNEVNLEKDVHPLRTETTEAELHGILTVLKLFTLYERRADEFWSDVIKNMFPRPEIQEMAALFGAVELSVHRRVYDKLNKLLFVSNDDFYSSYEENAAMKQRIEFMDDKLKNGSDLVRIAAFSFAEGVVLFSSFAFLMSFRANGKNVLPNIGLAIKMSQRDESTHCQASCWLFRTLEQELKELGQDTEHYYDEIYQVAEAVREHEHLIIDEIFSKGPISGITATQMKNFVDSRVDYVLKQLGLKSVYKVKYNPIADWFDKVNEGYQYNDFFAGAGSSYSRGWNEKGFVWNNNKQEEIMSA